MSIVTVNPWGQLRQWTAARIALGRSGVSQPTAPQLAFQLAHAQARDAVHMELDDAALAERLAVSFGLRCIRLHSAAPDRATYLRRPDLGRRLDDESKMALAPAAYETGFVIADGLSALAIERHAEPFLRAWTALNPGPMAPLAIVKQGRVAVGDEVAQLLGVELVVVMIGERPGLSSPDSMGLYLTWQPRVGMTDERRNCISNVRPEGLGYADAASKLDYLVHAARQRRISGVALKEEGAGPEALTLR
ncbi:ethanolamine ammonia-lyase subunit EutC [Massilia sp. R2A-15]|uniref:ethanolamine ammonia-lyase subunit EutC n=1 Tax=Massilia sp. R2A-15 TaxID=3064278 RepID=UPI002735A4A3|nr:ethanolamine ammonia-lyase subunit EutC [Massilia sp. R2A-15]WLI90998.1 ethanolamine ammonia-lyase subunit EutC [Massilia sp. R2A-15]